MDLDCVSLLVYSLLVVRKVPLARQIRLSKPVISFLPYAVNQLPQLESLSIKAFHQTD